MTMSCDEVKIGNPHLANIAEDNFHHLGLSTSSTDMKKDYSDVKFVCISGSDSRILKFAQFLQKTLGLADDKELHNICTTDRYVMYKVGPVLALSHGMGVPSASILLHELLKLLHYAGAKDISLFRMGTSGGLGASLQMKMPGRMLFYRYIAVGFAGKSLTGVEEGTIVVTTRAVDGLLRPYLEQKVLGKLVCHSTDISSALSEELSSYSKEVDLPFDVIQGDTMCCDCFYEGQGRLDGAFCDFSEDEKMTFLKKAHDAGVRNIEMESLVVASLCRRAGVKAAIVCVTLINRLEGDQISLSKDTLDEFQKRPWKLVAHYIKKNLPNQ